VKAGARPSANLLIFVLSDSSVQALDSGSMKVATYNNPVAPLAPKKAIVSEQDLHRELFTYQYAAHTLSGRRVEGIVQKAPNSERDRTDGTLTRVSKKSTEQYLSSLTDFFNMIIPAGIVIHHSAVLPDEDAPPKNKREVDKYHATRGFEIKCSGHTYHLAYHYIILENGKVQSGRPDRCEGAHAKGYNSYLGISVMGDFDSHDNPGGAKGPMRPNPKQMASLVNLARRLRLRYHIPVSRILRHSDVAETKCPGDRFPFSSFVRELKAGSGKPVLPRN
jgi:hypothetical protein